LSKRKVGSSDLAEPFNENAHKRLEKGGQFWVRRERKNDKKGHTSERRRPKPQELRRRSGYDFSKEVKDLAKKIKKRGVGEEGKIRASRSTSDPSNGRSRPGQQELQKGATCNSKNLRKPEIYKKGKRREKCASESQNWKTLRGGSGNSARKKI